MGHKSHLAGPLSYETFRKVNSLQLHAPFDESFRDVADRRAGSHRLGRSHDKAVTRLRQSLNVLVGVFVGLTGVLMRYCYEHLWQLRVSYVRHLLEDHSQVGLLERTFRSAAAAAVMTASLGLCASILVAWQPAAASSGIPGVISFLNGCDIRGALSEGVLLAKVVGTMLAVAAGLALGPEGPMVHIGALIGMLTVTSFVRPLLRHLGPKGQRLEDELSRQPLRYHVQSAAMGAGAGIAAAFNAPLAGTLFVVEEASSYFSKKLFLHTFITCGFAFLSAYFMQDLLGMEPESFYSRTNCTSNLQFDGFLVLQIALTSFTCSLLAVAFNRAVVKVSVKSTQEFQQLGLCWQLMARRFAIVVVVGALCGIFTVCFPAAMPCQTATLQRVFEGTSGCIPDEWLMQLMAGTRLVLPSQENPADASGDLCMRYIPSPGLFGAMYDPVRCKDACRLDQRCCLRDIEQHLHNTSATKDDYCCGFRSLEELQSGKFFRPEREGLPVAAPLIMDSDRWPQGPCGQTVVDPQSHIALQQYSPAAALSLVTPSAVLRNLLVRGSPRVLPVADVAVFLTGYGVLVVFSAVAWVPGGLLVPTMVLGAAAGRLCGLFWYWLLEPMSQGRRPPINWIPELAPLLELLYPKQSDHPQPGIPRSLG